MQFSHNINENNGFYDVRIVMTNEHNNVVEVNQSFQKIENACIFIDTKALEMIKHELIKYINHAVILYQNSDNSFYKSEKRVASLFLLQSFIKVIENESLRSLAFHVLNYEQDYRNILPAPGNNSYPGQLAKIESIVWFCVSLRRKAKQNN